MSVSKAAMPTIFSTAAVEPIRSSAAVVSTPCEAAQDMTSSRSESISSSLSPTAISIWTIEDFAPGDKLKITPDTISLSFVGTSNTGDTRVIFYEIRDGNTYVTAHSYMPTGYIDFTIKLIDVHELTADDFVGLRSDQSGMIAPGYPAMSWQTLADVALV